MLLASMGYGELTGGDWKTRVDNAIADLAAGEVYLLDKLAGIDLDKPISRDDAVQLICNALCGDHTGTLPTVKLVDEDSEFARFKYPENGLVVAPEKKMLTAVIDGKEANLEPGKTYNNVEMYITDYTGKLAVSAEGMPDYDYRTALYIDESGIVNSKSVTSAIKGGSCSPM